MSYPVSYPLYIEGRSSGQGVRFEPKPWTRCWAKHLDSECSGRPDCAACCLNEGDFEATAGLCPDHYEEIVGCRSDRFRSSSESSVSL